MSKGNIVGVDTAKLSKHVEPIVYKGNPYYFIIMDPEQISELHEMSQEKRDKYLHGLLDRNGE